MLPSHRFQHRHAIASNGVGPAILAATRYPHIAAAVTLVKCLRVGVDLGFHGDRTRTQVGPNLQSAADNVAAVADNIEKETQLGRRKGPYTEPPFAFFYSNPVGVVFKKGKSKLRVIHHLSWPRTGTGSSVNASIEDFDVKLDAFDKALKAVRELGSGCFMIKIDVESAYRCIPVRPADWPLLGLQWEGSFDIVMQFGITSATAIFEWYSSAAQYIVERTCAISYMVHYVDDFMILLHDLAVAKAKLTHVLAVFAELGIPVSLNKLEGPTTIMVFLGIVFDTEAMTIRLDDERLTAIHTELSQWQQRTTASREELAIANWRAELSQSKVVAPGRTFLRRMIDHMKSICPLTPNASTQCPLSNIFSASTCRGGNVFMTSIGTGYSIVPDVQLVARTTPLSIYTRRMRRKDTAPCLKRIWFSCQLVC